MEDRSQYESLDVQYVIKATGNPKPVATWTVDGKPITADSHLRMKVSEAGDEYKLEIKKLDMKDGGVYKCMLSNVLGEAKQQAKLTVIRKYQILRHSYLKLKFTCIITYNVKWGLSCSTSIHFPLI